MNEPIQCPDPECGSFAWYASKELNCYVCEDCGTRWGYGCADAAREQHVTAHEAARVLVQRGDDAPPMMLEDEFGVIDLPGDE